MSFYPEINDNDSELLFKSATNLRIKAISLGASVSQVSRSDTQDIIIKKIAEYTAAIVDS